jgi:hypothetical protein
MACIALLANPLAITTTQLVRDICREGLSRWQPELSFESRPLRMNWVVVVDRQGSRRLRMNWVAHTD